MRNIPLSELVYVLDGSLDLDSEGPLFRTELFKSLDVDGQEPNVRPLQVFQNIHCFCTDKVDVLYDGT